MGDPVVEEVKGLGALNFFRRRKHTVGDDMRVVGLARRFGGWGNVIAILD